MASPNWAYAVSQAVGGAAQSAVAGVDRQLKDEADQRAANRELDLKTRLMAADEAMKNRIEDRKRAKAVDQGQAINTGATGLLNTAAAGNINASFGSQIDPANPDSAATLAAIRANPAAMKAYGLPEEDDLTKARARHAAAQNQGDLAAASEVDKDVRNLVGDKRNADKDKTDNRRLDETQAHNMEMEKRQSAMAQATLTYQNRMLEAAKSRDEAQQKREETKATAEMRQATGKALDGANAVIKSLEKEVADPMLAPEVQKVSRVQLQRAMAEAEGYRKLLAGAGVDGGLPEATPAAAPAGRPPLSSFEKAGKPAPAPASAAPPSAKPTGLLATEAEYTPPADSPAGQLAARTATARATQSQADQQRLGNAQTLAQKALASRDPAEALQAQDAPGFALLPLDIRNQLFALARGK